MSFLKSIWKNNSKHEKLSEELALQNIKDTENESQGTVQTENDVVTFKLKYLGSTVVEKTVGETISVEAVKTILKQIKSQRKKPQRVDLAVSLKGVAVTDRHGNDVLKVSIYRISNCSTDASHPQVFSFTSTDSTETTECHAFSCGKRKFAETVALTVAHAFTTAYEAWRILPSTREFEYAMGNERVGIETKGKNETENGSETDGKIDERNAKEDEERLIELDDVPSPLVRIPKGAARSRLQMQLQRAWVSFDEEIVNKNQIFQ